MDQSRSHSLKTPTKQTQLLSVLNCFKKRPNETSNGRAMHVKCNCLKNMILDTNTYLL